MSALGCEALPRAPGYSWLEELEKKGHRICCGPFFMNILPGLGQRNLPMARPVSIIRLEKPHSLSYQLTTRTRPSEVTAVCGAAKIEERLSWLKSMETSGEHP